MEISREKKHTKNAQIIGKPLASNRQIYESDVFFLREDFPW
jgi:hypothetical protein